MMFPKPQLGVRALMQPRKAVLASEKCEAVIDWVRKDTSLKFLAVVDSDGVPVGAIERHTLLAAVSHPLHYAVFQYKPITKLLEADFLKVEARSSIDRLCIQLAEKSVSLNQGGVVVIEDGKYVGVLDNSDLLDQMMQINVARAKELSEAHETVMDSVNYASRIQQGLLPSVDRFLTHFKGAGLIWEPRDVVGGDIYWLSPVDVTGCFWVAMIDCTGHGVPGAMVSMLVAASLERIYDLTPRLNPGEVLAKLGDMIRRALHQEHKDASSNDGFDAALIKICPGFRKVIYAGARIGLFVVPATAGPLVRINGTKSALGYKGVTPHESLPETELDISDTRTLVIATDGVFDQPGGPFCRAFGPSRWMAAIDSCREQAPEEMARVLREALDEWRGQEMQRDDYSALVLGI